MGTKQLPWHRESTFRGRCSRLYRRTQRFGLVYRTVLALAVATALDASAATTASPSPGDDQSDDRPGMLIGFELAGGTGGTAPLSADRAERRASQSYDSGVALAAFGWGRKDGASFGLAAEALSVHQLSPVDGPGRTFAGTALGPFVRYGRGAFFATGVLAVGAFDKYGDSTRGGYDEREDDEEGARLHPPVDFLTAKFGLGVALYQTKTFELALTAAVMPTWTDAPHGDAELARRFGSSEFGLALNFYPRPPERPYGEPGTNFWAGCGHCYGCGDTAVRGSMLLLDLGARAAQGLTQGLIAALLHHH